MFSKDKPKKPGVYIARTIGWFASDIKKKKPGFWKYYWTVCNVRTNDDKKLAVQIWGYDKDIDIHSDVLENWEWSRFEPNIGVPDIPNPKPCWETEPEKWIPPNSTVSMLLTDLKD